jgi:general stress protein YciG
LRVVLIANESLFIKQYNFMAIDNENQQSGQQGGRGFAGMSEERRREIASKGGKAAHQSGNANEFDSESGREAGRKGGQSRNGESM